MEEVLEASVAERRFNLLLLGAFALIALALAAAGTYGVMAYLVTQRTREIGVRLAIGAQPGDVFRLVVGRGLMLAPLGVALGLGTAAACSRACSAAMLFNVEPTDAFTFVVSSVVLLDRGGGRQLRSGTPRREDGSARSAARGIAGWGLGATGASGLKLLADS